MDWKQATTNALARYSDRHKTNIVRRRALVREELSRIVSDAGSRGATPYQTLSRVLQQLRDSGVLAYIDNRGTYVLLFRSVDVEREDLPDEAIDAALHANKLRFGVAEVGEMRIESRRRHGQDRVRKMLLENYGHRCALCDEADVSLLVASHVSRWADDPDGRGDLTKSSVCADSMTCYSKLDTYPLTTGCAY